MLTTTSHTQEITKGNHLRQRKESNPPGLCSKQSLHPLALSNNSGGIRTRKQRILKPPAQPLAYTVKYTHIITIIDYGVAPRSSRDITMGRRQAIRNRVFVILLTAQQRNRTPSRRVETSCAIQYTRWALGQLLGMEPRLHILYMRATYYTKADNAQARNRTREDRVEVCHATITSHAQVGGYTEESNLRQSG